jgi:hypothetical protein
MHNFLSFAVACSHQLPAIFPCYVVSVGVGPIYHPSALSFPFPFYSSSFFFFPFSHLHFAVLPLHLLLLLIFIFLLPLFPSSFRCTSSSSPSSTSLHFSSSPFPFFILLYFLFISFFLFVSSFLSLSSSSYSLRLSSPLCHSFSSGTAETKRHILVWMLTPTPPHPFFMFVTSEEKRVYFIYEFIPPNA